MNQSYGSLPNNILPQRGHLKAHDIHSVQSATTIRRYHSGNNFSRERALIQEFLNRKTRDLKRCRFKSGLSNFTIILTILLGEAAASAATTLTVSDEAFGNNSTTRAIANALDDSWAASFPTGAFRPDLFSGGSGYSGTKIFVDPTSASYRVDWQLGYVDTAGPGLPTATTFVPATSGTATYGPSTSLQSGAPNPYSSETRLSTGFSGSGLNGIKFDFVNSTTSIYEFGFFVGDLESRANNGTEGRVILFDISGTIIGDHPIRYTGSVNGSGGATTYTSIEALGSPSGPANNNTGDWGNATTAFLSISSDVPIGSVIVHVGDDDHTNNETGTQEQMGIAAFQLPAAPITVGAAQLAASKVVEPLVAGGYALPGTDMVYRITVINEGTGTADADSIVLIDRLPDEVTFYNGDFDDAGPASGPVEFTQSAAALTFDSATDLRFWNGVSAPATFAACSYTPASGYDPNITHVCLNPKGSMMNGSPDPEFSVRFRTRIN